MFYLAICMEQENRREELEELLHKWREKFGLPVKIKSFESGKIFAFQMTDEDTPDVLFFDVCNDSEETQNIVKAYQSKHLATSYINVGVFDKDNFYKLCEYQTTYVTYPLIKEEIYEIAKREYKKYYTDEESYVFLKRPQYVKIALKRVVYFASSQRKIKAVCIDGQVYEFYKQLDNVEEELRGKRIKFIRTHQSQLVNPEYVKAYCGDEIVLRNGEKLSVAATRRRRVRLQFQMLDLLC